MKIFQYNEEEEYLTFIDENNYSLLFVGSRKCVRTHYALNLLYEKDFLLPTAYFDLNDHNLSEVIGRKIKIDVLPTFIFFQRKEIIYIIRGLDLEKLLKKIKKYELYSIT